MTSKTKILLTWVATAVAAGLQVTLLAQEPKNEKPIQGKIQLQQKGEQQATEARSRIANAAENADARYPVHLLLRVRKLGASIRTTSG